VKERPILFQGAMVRALLAGTKTQTRRAVRVQPGPSCCIEEGMAGESPFVYSQLHGDGPGHEVHERRSPCACPYGQPGDRLWVREAFMHEPADYCWEASVSIPSRPASTVYRADFPDSQPGEGWKPSIHMPRALCRIELDVTGVRVERLQAISDADAAAEGCPCYVCGRTMDGRSEDDCHCFHRKADARDYRDLWESINGDGSWDANPWVWVVEFRRVQP
jgi:hypothetical protein